MRRSAIETILGAIVILVAGFFLVFSYKTANVSAGSGGYIISANFSGIGGLKPGDDVQISGVKVGAVSSVSLNPETFLARVDILVGDKVQLPVDTAALISSESLLGGRYLALEPGADEDVIPPGGVIQFTQAPQNLEQLLGQFIFSVNDEKNKDKDASGDDIAASAGDDGEETAPALEQTAPSPAPQPEAAPAVETPAAETVPQEIPEASPEAAAPAETAPAEVTIPAVTAPDESPETAPVESQDAAPAHP